MSMTCSVCGTTAAPRTYPTANRVIGEPVGWSTLSISNTERGIRNHTLCGSCANRVLVALVPIPVLADGGDAP